MPSSGPLGSLIALDARREGDRIQPQRHAIARHQLLTKRGQQGPATIFSIGQLSAGDDAVETIRLQLTASSTCVRAWRSECRSARPQSRESRQSVAQHAGDGIRRVKPGSRRPATSRHRRSHGKLLCSSPCSRVAATRGRRGYRVPAAPTIGVRCRSTKNAASRRVRSLRRRSPALANCSGVSSHRRAPATPALQTVHLCLWDRPNVSAVDTVAQRVDAHGARRKTGFLYVFNRIAVSRCGRQREAGAEERHPRRAGVAIAARPSRWAKGNDLHCRRVNRGC